MTRVITYGTFDLFHEGHYRLLKRAKELGDYLIVGVTTEKYDMERGKLNVVDSLMTRIENVKKSGFADEVIIEEAVGQKISDVQKYHIDIFAIGSDLDGGRLIIYPITVKWSIWKEPKTYQVQCCVSRTDISRK